MKRFGIGIAFLAIAATACASLATDSNHALPIPSWNDLRAAKATPSAAPSVAPAPSSSVNPSPLPSPAAGSVDPNADPIVRVVQHALPAVVNVTTNLLETNPFGGSTPGRGVGTGFVVRSDGIVVTNFHVVEGAQRITVTTSIPPTKSFQARVIGGDQNADLAVLKVDATGLPTLALGDSGQLELGQPVVAMGYALALNGGPSVTSGIVSSLDREITAADPNFPKGKRTYSHVVQTDAAINPGNSGGPMLDLNGNVVGINTAAEQQAENIGFAIAIDAAKATIEGAIANPSAPVAFLGVTTTSVTPLVKQQEGLSVDHGALVLAVAPKGPAETAGMKTGDVVVKFDGHPVDSSDALGTLIQNLKPGDAATVGVVHKNGSKQTYHVNLGVRPLPTASP
ncbi:MAG TPA: trypsin-like peptidase domain-containing protein [Actinomycetota bacterium]|nr:trypsin-like peptidase domain-containing protein [Actinomycetota bacterium]